MKPNSLAQKTYRSVVVVTVRLPGIFFTAGQRFLLYLVFVLSCICQLALASCLAYAHESAISLLA